MDTLPPLAAILLFTSLASIGALAGALGAYIFGSALEGYIPISLSLTAGFFIYIATSDIIPEIHYETKRPAALLKSGLLLCGVAVIYISLALISNGE